ncbi:polymer-forming cytoskeletal protein [Evansella sp. AB-P1]|uniref:bactofilin family protein n=1 Tax=Evansella sp. AB-P1 TaxID=3037653 RepID=UPI00241E9BE4|nr:polymer-forming cytoskeletal protein [Evansella sp. AB-P1]MDG5789531.1 polymer-forming cytoskeletal protein [Evansella sp. AB-P1]
MFAKQKDKKLNEITTIIGSGTTIKGQLHIESSIRIDGKVFGEVKCLGDVTIGKEGYVENALSARNLFIAGTMKGNANIENKIHIYETGFLDGSAEMQTIVIDEKGHFNGKSMMKGNKDMSIKGNIVDIEQEKSKEEK